MLSTSNGLAGGRMGKLNLYNVRIDWNRMVLGPFNSSFEFNIGFSDLTNVDEFFLTTWNETTLDIDYIQISKVTNFVFLFSS